MPKLLEAIAGIGMFVAYMLVFGFIAKGIFWYYSGCNLKILGVLMVVAGAISVVLACITHDIIFKHLSNPIYQDEKRL